MQEGSFFTAQASDLGEIGMCVCDGRILAYCRLSEKSDGMDDVFRKRPYMFAFQARNLQLNDKTAKHCNATVTARVFDFKIGFLKFTKSPKLRYFFGRNYLINFQ